MQTINFLSVIDTNNAIFEGCVNYIFIQLYLFPVPDTFFFWIIHNVTMKYSYELLKIKHMHFKLQ